MSGQRETSFLINDSKQAQRLRSGEVSGRVERLFGVEVELKAPSETAAGSQQQQEGHWVTLRTSDGDRGSTEEAKKYILSLCGPEAVQECASDQQFVEQLLSASSKLRDDLETDFQTVVLPGSSPSCVRVQGTVQAVHKTIAKIHSVMAPSPEDDMPQPQPSPSPTPHPRPPSSQSIPSPPTTAGTFSPSPPPPSASLSSTSDPERQNRERKTPHELPNIPTPSGTPLAAGQPNKQEILRKIALGIENENGGVMARGGVDSAQREQTIQYFISLHFPRDMIEATVDSMGEWAELDDILKRLNGLNTQKSVPSRPVSGLSGSRSYTPRGEPVLNSNSTLRPIVIDGSNVAMSYSNGRVFSCRGIQLAVNWFVERGHKDITVFVPQWRREAPCAEYPITDQEILNQLCREKVLSFTPSRRIGHKKIVCYDDRFIVQLASETNGVIVSNDNYRDIAKENENWRRTIETRLLMFTFANDRFMVPEDPLGKHGPGLKHLLHMEPLKSSSKGGSMSNAAGPQVCPYGEKCNFGRKCRFLHPEREGRQMDHSVFTSRSTNGSPTPAERRHMGGIVEKDSGIRPTGQPIHSSPQRPRTSPSFPGETEMMYTHTPQPVSSSHGYSQPQPLPHGYSQMPGDYLARSGMIQQDEVCSQNQPQYLRIPPVTSGSSLSPPPLHPSPRHSNPSTPMGGGGVVSYPSHTFPIATLPTGRSRNVTDRIQPSVSPIPNGSIAAAGDDFQPTAPNPHPIIPPHQPSIDPPLGLTPRGDCAPMPYPSIPPAQYHTGHTHEMYHNSFHPHPSYHVPPAVFPSSAGTYTHTDMQQQQHHRRHSPTKSVHLSDYSTTPGNQVPPQTNMYHNHLQTSETHAYSATGSMYQHDHRQTPLFQHQVPTHNQGGHVMTNEPSKYRAPYSAQGPRAASMYGDMRRHVDRIAGEKFQSSQSSPELYTDTNRHYHPPPPPPVGGGCGVSGTFNWTLFRQAQARLPDKEPEIMRIMQQYPNADLECLIDLVQCPW